MTRKEYGGWGGSFISLRYLLVTESHAAKILLSREYKKKQLIFCHFSTDMTSVAILKLFKNCFSSQDNNHILAVWGATKT